jgi:hypothetical protein
MKFLKLRNPRLLKVYAKEHDYKYYCRVEDFNPDRETDIAKLFRPKEGDIVVDVGAHIGKYTILLLQKWLGLEEKYLQSKLIPSTMIY